MSFLMKGYTFSVCQYYKSIVCRTKAHKRWHPLFHNLNKELPIFKSFCSKSTLSVTNVKVKRYLDHLMDDYRNENRINDTSFEILQLQKIPLLLNERIKITENIMSLNDLVSTNEEMKKLAEEEDSMYGQQLLEIDKKILDTILQYFVVEHYDSVIMEIAQGVGGQEAMLFAKDLLNMYVGYFNYLGFSYEIMELLESDTGGLRKASILISDSAAFKKLQFECGVHRVQRIPATEKSGRLHTSTAVVNILPEPKDVDIQLEEKDLKIESKKASGAGGQHVNTTNSAIRITHLPTGKSVSCQTDRSQLKNRKLALRKLKSVLYQEQVDQHTSFISSIRKKQIGTRMRNEKIRTYNYNQDRITDHRIPNGTVHNLKDFMKGGEYLQELDNKLYKDMQQKIFLEIVEKAETELK